MPEKPKKWNLKKVAARTFHPEPGGNMSIKTYGHGGHLINERIVPESEGRQIKQGYRPKEPPTGPYRKVD